MKKQNKAIRIMVEVQVSGEWFTRLDLPCFGGDMPAPTQGGEWRLGKGRGREDCLVTGQSNMWPANLPVNCIKLRLFPPVKWLRIVWLYSHWELWSRRGEKSYSSAGLHAFLACSSPMYNCQIFILSTWWQAPVPSTTTRPLLCILTVRVPRLQCTKRHVLLFLSAHECTWISLGIHISMSSRELVITWGFTCIYKAHLQITDQKAL